VLPGLGQLADQIQILVVLHEAVVDQPGDFERWAVAEDIRDQPRDVALQRLDVGVAVRGLGRPLPRRDVESAIGLTTASGERHQKEQGREPEQAAATHAGQRGCAAGGGVEAGAAGAAGADAVGRGGAAGGVGDVGAAGSAGAGVAGAAGALAGAGASRTTELPCSPPRMASENEGSAKTIAIPVVILPSSVGVPIEPNTAWLPAPPKAEPMSAPLPDCKRTMPMMAKHAST